MDRHHQNPNQQKFHFIIKYSSFIVILGIIALIVSYIFEIKINVYRNWLIENNVSQNWTLFAVGYFFYRITKWISVDYLIIPSLWIFGVIFGMHNPKLKLKSPNTKQIFFIISYIFGYIIFNSIIYPPYYINILIFGIGLFSLIAIYFALNFKTQHESKLDNHTNIKRPKWQHAIATVATFKQKLVNLIYKIHTDAKSKIRNIFRKKSALKLNIIFYTFILIIFVMLDYCFDIIENDPQIVNKMYVLLEIGPIKTSKIWVQASLPQWFPYKFSLNDPNFRNMVKPFVEAVVNRYKNRPSLFAYQIENEPDLMIHTVTDPDEDYIILGNLIPYLDWLNKLVKSIDPKHFTAINMFANNLNTVPRFPMVDLVLYDYYASVPDTPPMNVYARRWATYTRPNTAFGVAELQLNDWHFQITEDFIDNEYQMCLNSAMNMILWSELHTSTEYEHSAIDHTGNPTWKYYKIQSLYDDFINQDFNPLIIQFKFDLQNLLYIATSIVTSLSIIAFLSYYLLIKPSTATIGKYHKLNRHKSNNKLNHNKNMKIRKSLCLNIDNNSTSIDTTVATHSNSIEKSELLKKIIFYSLLLVYFPAILTIPLTVSNLLLYTTGIGLMIITFLILLFEIIFAKLKYKIKFYYLRILIISLLAGFVCSYIGFKAFY
ncbi:MAG: hypothetical protein ACTSRZ_14680 [Promethearchaeota archaeon]